MGYESLMTLRVKTLLAMVLLASISARAQRFEDNAPHDIQVIDRGLGALALRLDMIERAHHSIEMEYFLWGINDRSARLVSQALAKKAREGVKVRIVVDSLRQILELDEDFQAAFRKNGLELRVYNDASALTRRGQERLHQKFLIVDGQELITGGRNIEDYYFNLSPEFNFLDRDVWVKGPIVQTVRRGFEEIWNAERTVTLPDARPPVHPFASPRSQPGAEAMYNSSLRRFRDKMKFAHDYFVPNAKDAETRGWVETYGRKQLAEEPRFQGPVVYVADRPFPNRGEDHIFKEISVLVQQTKSAMTIETAYLILQDDGMKMLEGLQRRGVAVTMFTDSALSSDSLTSVSTFYGQAPDLVARGVNLRVFNGQVLQADQGYVPPVADPAYWSMHAKTAVFDDDTTWIGTYNLDPRSKYLNIEDTFVFPHQPEMAAFVKHSIEARMIQSHEIDRRDESGKVIQLKTGCEGKSLIQCSRFYVSRWIGEAIIDLL